MSVAISDLCSVGSVENVVVFIADSVRYDALPDLVSREGIEARAVAPSTFTASSIPALLTGRYPSDHRVWSFDGGLSEPPPLFTGPEAAAFDYDDEFHLQPRVLDDPRRSSLDELSTPFVYVYHDRGGHLPYDEPFEDYSDMRDFFERHRDPAELGDMYERSVKDSGRRFLALLDELRDRERLEDTLAIYVSDHGELLGEYGGLFTHAVPMVPELVDVPMVFAGAGLPTNERYDALLSGVDLAPTVLGALGRSVPSNVRGTNLWAQPPDDRLVRSEVWKRTRYDYLQSYTAGSVWDENGGYVCHRESRVHRLAYSLGVHLIKGPHAPLARSLSPNTYRALLAAHLPETIEYGTPGFDAEVAHQRLPPFEDASDRPRDEVDHERLKRLGYLE